MTQAHPDGVRLQKVLAQAGVASRRAAVELISAGRRFARADRRYRCRKALIRRR